MDHTCGHPIGFQERGPLPLQQTTYYLLSQLDPDTLG